MSRPRPDFFIVGAAKCGTTALFEYLSRHPGVFMPAMKEPKFFCSDIRTSGGVYRREDYDALFAAAPRGCLTGEASALYLYSGVAIHRIMAHNPLAKILVMLRDPVAAAQSLHAARWGHGHENIGSFEEAWRAQSMRLQGQRMPALWPDPVTLQYGAIYCYAPQVRRLLERVPPGQLCIMLFEEFFADPGWFYGQILKFLDLAPQPDLVYRIVNPSVAPRCPGIARWLREPPRALQALYAPLRPILRATRLRPAAIARSLNSTPKKKPVLPAAFRGELDRYFAADVAELEGLLGRALWRERSLPSASGLTRET